MSDTVSDTIIKEWLHTAQTSLTEIADDNDRMTDTDIRFEVPDYHLNELKANNVISYGILEEIKTLKSIEKQQLEELKILKYHTIVNNLTCSFILVGVVLIINKMRN